MTRDEAIQLLDCSLSELADYLGITTAAVAKWNKKCIPRLREYEIRDIASKRKTLSHLQAQQNLTHRNN